MKKNLLGFQTTVILVLILGMSAFGAPTTFAADTDSDTDSGAVSGAFDTAPLIGSHSQDLTMGGELAFDPTNLTPEAISSLPPEQIATLPPEIINSFSPEAAAFLSAAQVGAISPEAFAQLSPEVVAELAEHANHEQCQQILPAIFSQLPAEAIGELAQEATPEQVAEIPAETFSELPAEAISELAPEATPEQVQEIAPETFSELPTEAVSELAEHATPEQVAEIPADTFSQLPAESVGELAEHASAEQVASLPPETVAELPAEAITEIAAEATPEQLASLPTETVSELAKDSDFGEQLASDSEFTSATADQLAKEAKLDDPNLVPAESDSTVGSVVEVEAITPTGPDLTNPEVATNYADLSLDNHILSAASYAEHQETLDQAFAEIPAGTESVGTTEGAGEAIPNAEALVAQRMAALGASAQEAAVLGYGAPGDTLGTDGQSDLTESQQGMVESFEAFRGCFETATFDSIMGDYAKVLPPEALAEAHAQFETVHENFMTAVEQFERIAFGETAATQGELTPGTLPEGAPMPLVGIQDFSTVVAAGFSSDPGAFMEKMAEAIESRIEGQLSGLPIPGGPMPEGTFLGPAAIGPEGFTAVMGGALPAGMDPSTMMAAFPMDAAAFLGIDPATLATQVGQDQIFAIAVANTIMTTLPPEALALLGALNTDFTAADLTFLQDNPGSTITRAFSADIANTYEGQSYPGLEHIHVTYSRDADGDGLYPVDHVDANVTAIHDENHTTSVVLDTEGADHIPGIQA